MFLIGVSVLNYLEDNIQKLYSNLNIHTPQQLNAEYVTQKLNIPLFYWDETSQALFNNGSGYIFLNRNLLPNFKWEEFCHELAHILYHAGDQMKMNTMFREYQESKANSFALQAAVPSFMLHKIDLPNDYYAAVRLIQQTFKVSLSFAMKRLNHFLANHELTDSQKPSLLP